MSFILLTIVLFANALIANSQSVDFLLYGPSTSDASVAMGKTYVSVTSAQFSSMTVAQLRNYKALVFADPNCASSTAYLPTTNLANLYGAVNGNVVVIGTDELYHWGQGGATMASSVLAYVASEPGKTGLYASFSCYYHGASPQPVPFLAPLTTDQAFKVQGAPGCFNNAHIVAVSPALRGLTDASVSNWSCSVHEVFFSFPKEFIPLAIARGISGAGSIRFADGSFGIPYILARGATLSPIACGDRVVVHPQEQCDSGTGCTVKCVCGDGYKPTAPVSVNCQLLDMCGLYGYSGKPANAISCTNGVNQRTITCAEGYYPIGASMDSRSITLIGSAPFQGCTTSNLCTIYGYSGLPANTLSCTPLPGQRRIDCQTGYHARGSSPATSTSVTLAGSTAFQGCVLIDNCVAYGYSGNAANTKQCINGVNQRTIECLAGYAAIAPTTPTITLIGSAAFAGCTLIDNCAQYGYSGKPANAVSCANGINTRTITCGTGYYAKAPISQGAGAEEYQYKNGIPTITLIGSTAFEGCAEINRCVVYGCKDGVSGQAATCALVAPNSRSCTCPANYFAVGQAQPTPSVTLAGSSGFSGCSPIKACALYGTPPLSTCVDSSPNVRTITCNAGYYAIAPSNPTVSVLGAAGFAGCQDIDECAVYGGNPAPGNIASCTQPAINQRTITCNAGYYAISPSTPTITLTGSAPFPGCRDINECALYGFSGKPANVQECVDGVNKRTITCLPGFHAVAPSTPSVTLVADAVFNGCTDIDECAVYGYGGQPYVKSCVNSAVNQRTITCETGYYAASPAGPSIVLTGAAGFAGCKDIDECAVYGYSGLTAHTVSCVNSALNERTITCAVGYYPSGVAGGKNVITLTGSVAFGGCLELNQCTEYGYSGNGQYAQSCVSSPGSRVVTCLPGYWVTGTTSQSIKLGNAEKFVGCTEINECDTYGYSGKADYTLQCIDGVNKRTIVCKPGYYAVAPATASVVLVGNAPFAGCVDINECAAFGYSGKDANTVSCVNSAVNQRTITCKTGYWAVAPDTPVVTIIGSGAFEGCTDIDECSIYRFSGKPENAVSCVQGINQRTITCAAGYYAVAPTNPTITLIGNAAFAGCSQTDMCATNSNGGNVATCVNGINQRTLTCKAGYYAIAPSNPVATITGPVAFAGCTDISECAVYKCVDAKSGQATSCADAVAATPVNTRVCTCPDGWFSVGKSPSRAITLTGSDSFPGCAELCGDGKKVGAEGCDDGNLASGDGCFECKVETGWRCPTPGAPCVTICGDGNKNGAEECDDGNLNNDDGCTNSCKVEPGWKCPTPGAPCILLQLCLILGYDGNDANTKSCVNGINTRTITCATGYYAIAPSNPTIKVVGYDKFQGCSLIDNCKLYGYSGKASYTQSCENGVNQRKITCLPGYFAVAPDVDNVVLVGSADFKGCTEIDECALYGYSGKSENTLRCVDGLLQRTITCQAGYYAVSPAVPSVTLKGKDAFEGCKDIDECTVYGNSGKPDFIEKCTNLINARTMTCQPGYYAIAPATPDVTLTASAEFKGCADIDECAVYGYSGKTAFVESCLNAAPNTRTITCQTGYYPNGAAMNSPSIILTGNTPFGGCELANTCTTFGYSDKPDNTLSCVSGVNTRNITCAAGFIALPGKVQWVQLTGDAVFGGCQQIDECALYGYNNDDKVESCTDGIDSRTITCKDGYYAVAPATPSVKLVGSAAFAGCKDIDECATYGYSGHTSNVKSCTHDFIDTRTITCEAGYWAIAPDTPSVTLRGSATFAGCTLINTCNVYGYGLYRENTLSCVPGINERTITCIDGYYAAPPAEKSIKLIGDAAFKGCHQTDMCFVYGYGENASCKVTGPNQRTITCAPGYYAEAPVDDTIVIDGPVKFAGCKDIDECAVYGCDSDPLVTSCSDSLKDKQIAVHSRVCTCPKGYSPRGLASQQDGGSITLLGAVPFGGCMEMCGDGKIIDPETCDDGNARAGDGCSATCQVEAGWTCTTPGSPCINIDECALYKDKDGRVNVKACVDGVNNRTLVCADGYYAVAPDTGSVTLVGSAAFAGCTLIKTCAVYGANGQTNVHSCTEGVNTRTVSCIDGYVVTGTSSPSITLIGNQKFPGCTKADMCQLYVIKNGPVKDGICFNTGTNTYDITCNPGYYAIPPATRTIELKGANAPFPGCKEIDECVVYGYSGATANTESCTDGINSRTVTCKPGFYAERPDKRSIVLEGNRHFQGCFDIQECSIYGSSGKPNVLSCVETLPNTRTITCQDGYYPIGGKKKSVTLIGNEAFKGCDVVIPECGNGYLEPQIGETCDDGNKEDGDGCSSGCKKQEGYVCDVPGEKCCSALSDIQTNPLTCLDGFWTPRDQPGGTIYVHGTGGREIPPGTQFCGNVVVDKEDVTVDENRLILDNVTWVVQGTMIVYGSTLEFLNGGNILFKDEMSKTCSGIYKPLNKKRQMDHDNNDPLDPDENYQYWMSHNSTLEYSDVHWKNDETTPTPIINSPNSVFIDGTFRFKAPRIPNGSNKFQPINAGSVDIGDLKAAHNIPGTCSDIELKPVDGKMMKVVVNRKHLCHASIIAMSLFIGIVGILAIAGAIYYYKTHRSESVEGYYAL